LIIYGEYELWSSLLSVSSTLLFLASNIFLNTPSQTHSSCVPPVTIQQERAFKIHMKNGHHTGYRMSFTRVPTSTVRLRSIFYALLGGNFKKSVLFIFEQCCHQFW
jgi:hypothetical protein